MATLTLRHTGPVRGASGKYTRALRVDEGSGITLAQSWDPATEEIVWQIDATGGGGGGAPTTAQYLTLATDATLTQERVLTFTAPLVGTDSGAGGAYTVAIAPVGETRGDLLVRGAAQWTRLAIGTAGSVLGSDGSDPAWTIRKVLHGWPLNATGAYDFTLSYDAGTRVLTLTRTGASMGFWRNGAWVDLGASVSTVAHAATSGLWYLYYSAAGILTVSMTPWTLSNAADICDVPLATVLLDTTTTPDQAILHDERHTAYRDLGWHRAAHLTVGARRQPTGAVFGGYTLATDTLLGVQWSLTSVTIHDEDIQHASSAIAAAGPYLVLSRTGASGTWTWDATRTLPWLSDGAAHASYNAVSGGVWTAVSASGGSVAYICAWVYAWNAYTASERIVIIPGQTSYTTLAAARAETPSSLALGNLPSAEMVPVGRVVLGVKASYSNTTEDARIEYVERYFPTGGSATLSGVAGTHSSLSGLPWTGSGHTGSAGSIPVFDASGIADEVAPSTLGYPLLAGGAGTPPAYGQVGVGGMYSSATSRVLGRKTAGAGTVEELTLGAGSDVAPGTVDAAAATGSLRTLGMATTAACPGNQGFGPALYTPPPLGATLTWYNQTAGGVTAQTADLTGALALYSTYRTSDNHSLMLATGTSIAACFEVVGTPKKNMTAGLCWASADASPKIEVVIVTCTATGSFVLAWVKFSSVTSWTADRATLLTANQFGRRLWLRLYDDGAYRHVQTWSEATAGWIDLTSSVSRTDFLTPTRVGLTVNPNIPSGGGSGDTIALLVRSMVIT